VTVSQLLAEGARGLRDAGVPSPEWDAELLLRHVLGWDRGQIVASPAAPVPDEAMASFRRLLVERARRVPLQHLTGSQAFWRQEFRVTPDVLVPRPETEVVVEAALEMLRGRPRIVDVGTGSGCVALSLAAERPDADVDATDVSERALAVARDNAQRLGLASRVRFHRGDLLEPVGSLFGRIGLVVSNPPYVDPCERDTLAPEVRDHEPSVALFAPGEALSVYRRLVPAAAVALEPEGALVLEIAPGLAEPVSRLLAAAGFERIEVRPDLAGRQRAVLGRLSRRAPARLG
jgi:release factor glutamine methyltransferase